MKLTRLAIIISPILFAWPIVCSAAPEISPFPQTPASESADPEYYKPYLALISDVFGKMDEFYYKPVSKEKYNIYVAKYKNAVLSKLGPHKDRIDMVAYRGAGLLVEALRDPKDKFTTFIPPTIAKEYKKQIYGYENGIGISGHMAANGYLIDHVQIRSNAFALGIRQGSIVLKINGTDAKTMTDEDIKKLFFPELGAMIKLEVFDPVKNTSSLFDVKCEEYFMETIKELPTETPGVYCLKILSFNRMTADDLKDYVKALEAKGMKRLIIDVTDNPGGPPLAVRELSGLFLPAGSRLFYYKKKGVPEFGLVTPKSDVTYKGQIVIIVNNMSGSASELFAGTFKAYKRAIIMGKARTAGFAFLKSTFNYDDGCMLAIVTGLSYLFDGTEVSMSGIDPQYIIPADTTDVLKYVLEKTRDGTIFKDTDPWPTQADFTKGDKK